MAERTLLEQTLFRQKLELLILTQDEDILSQAREVISRNKLTFRHYKEANQDLPMGTEMKKPAVVLIQQRSDESIESLSHRVQLLLGDFPRASIITILHDDYLKEDLRGTENDRVYPFSRSEFFDTGKFETIVLAKTRSQYFVIQPSDLFPMTSIGFTAFVQLSLNQRYLAVLYRKIVLSEERLTRIADAKGLLISVAEAAEYHRYIASYYDHSGSSLKKRARSLFYSITSNWLTLFDYLSLDYKTLPEEQVQKTFEALQSTIEEIVELFKSEEDLWDVFREASDSPLFKLWRSPWIAIYSGLIAAKSGVGDPSKTILAGLLSDIGLSNSKIALIRKYLDMDPEELSAEEKSELRKFPMDSLNRSLQKKLPLSDEIKGILVATQERFDEKGFPNQVPADKIPEEASLIRFATLIDQGARTKLEDTNPNFRLLREKLWEIQKEKGGNFSPDFLEKIANALV